MSDPPVAQSSAGNAQSTSDPTNNDKEIAQGIMKKAALLVKEANGLPKRGGDFELCNSFPAFNGLMQQQQGRVQTVMNKLLAVAGARTRLPAPHANADEYVDRVIDVADKVSERAGIVMDELERARRNEEVKVPEAIIGAESTRRGDGETPEMSKQAQAAAEVFNAIGRRLRGPQPVLPSLGRTQGCAIPKPQLVYGFASSIDNSQGVFKPKLKVKFHEAERRRDGVVVVDEDEEGNTREWASDESTHQHPYTYELHTLQPAEWQMKPVEMRDVPSLDDTPLLLVDSNDKLQHMINELNQCKEFAVDVEHHEHRSFLGLSCLVQISSREKDWIIDPFPIWNDMWRLGEPFANPNILKVLHGADSDVVWLQRDFGIYIVNMFDTGKAMHRLEYPKFSLAYLVSRYHSITLNKEYQLTDWRLRPLPEDYLHYARQDTHYLLNCADRLRNELIEKGNEMNNLLTATYKDGTMLCEKVYEKPEFHETGYEKLVGKRRTLNNRQLFAMQELWRWRDRVARQEDDSVHYVLPDHMLIHIAESLPREMQGIVACCNPVPLCVREHLLDLHKMVYAARDRPLEAPLTSSSAAAARTGSLLETRIDEQNRMTKMKAMLRCRIDFSHSAYNEMIGSSVKGVKVANGEKEEKMDGDSFISVIAESATREKEQQSSEGCARVAELTRVLESWASPFECYQMAVKEWHEQEGARLEAEKARKAAEGAGEKKTFTHHDPVVCRKPVLKEQKMHDDISLSGPAKDKYVGPTEQEILTKKALKRKNKYEKTLADMPTSDEARAAVARKEGKAKKEEGEVEKEEEGEEEEEQMAPVPTKKGRRDVGPVEVVDYSQYDSRMFSQQHTEASDRAYDPFRQSNRRGRGMQKERGRGRGRGGGPLSRGGFTRNRGMSGVVGGRGGGARGRGANSMGVQKLREMRSELSCLGRTDGSCSFSAGRTTVFASVSGPGDVHVARRLNESMLVDVSYRQRSGDAAHSPLNSIVESAVRTVVNEQLFPRTTLVVTVHSLQDDGSAGAAALTAAGLALLDAAVPATSPICGVNVVRVSGELIVDPDRRTEKKADATFLFAFTMKPDGSAAECACDCSGAFSPGELFAASSLAATAASEVFVFFKECMQRKLSVDHFSKMRDE